MCMSCVSSTEVVIGQLGLVAAIVKEPVHRALADAGVVAPIDPVRRDVRTVSFLRRLDLDPVEILGEAAVAAADAWVPPAYEPRRSARPIGSQSLLTTQ